MSKIKDLVCFTVVFCFAAACFGSEDFDRIIVKVDNGIITASDLVEASIPAIENVKKNYPEDQWPVKIKMVKKNILDQMINEHICIRMARELELAVTDAEVEAQIMGMRENFGIATQEEFIQQLKYEGMTLDELKDSVRRQASVRKVLQREVYSKIKVRETEIEKYYKDNADVFRKPAKVRLALLMCKAEGGGFSWKMCQDRIEDIHKKIESGLSFSEAVKTFSDGPAKDEGGDIGFITKGKGLPAFEDAAFQLNVGDISKPIKSEFGWNIIKILEKENASVGSLADVREQITSILRRTLAHDLEREWFETQRSRTYIQEFDY